MGTMGGPSGDHVGTMWGPRGDHVGTTWVAPRGPHVARTRSPRGPHVVPTWSPRGPHVVPTRGPGGNHVGTTWGPSGDHVGTMSMWGPRGDHVGTKWGPSFPRCPQTGTDLRYTHVAPTIFAQSENTRPCVEANGHGPSVQQAYSGCSVRATPPQRLQLLSTQGSHDSQRLQLLTECIVKPPRRARRCRRREAGRQPNAGRPRRCC